MEAYENGSSARLTNESSKKDTREEKRDQRDQDQKKK